MKKLRKMIAFCAGLVLMYPIGAAADADRETAISSLVRIRCTFDDGSEMAATGFAWNDKMHVVTALHAVAGCEERLVKKENGKLTTADIESVSLVADLAYLKLNNDIGLQPAEVVSELTTTRGDYFTWGYPHGILESFGAQTHFASGQKGGLTTLLALRGVEQLEGLFKGQHYPRKDTSILRVTSTLQPGQSGAPIINDQGLVVAIADGGLLGGFKGINWSIPAFKYLDGLPYSDDPIPQDRSVWAALYSKVTPAPVDAGEPQTALTEPTSQALGSLRHVRTIPLSVFEEILIEKGQEDSNIQFIREISETPDHFDQLSFHVYEDPVTGATLGIPAGLEPIWDEEIGLLHAETQSLQVAMSVAILSFQSFTEAKEIGKDYFVSTFHDYIDWETSPNELYVEANDEWKWANGAGFFAGIEKVSGSPVDVNLSVTISENEVLGYAVFGPELVENLPTEDLIAYLMMQMSVMDLSGFAEF
ncbi:S1 family peptidase [Sedimentitalea todarodis]|uniref:Serine protease n=1 Tax=Sedimentitalea todarodis TaxID=1631240 RepID=A0ABU3VKV1_9RHOB|nr:serine protease [Sedimentitalea todarodis]MDU9006832.1 serine protease [Sedimentitalea todarodis]